MLDGIHITNSDLINTLKRNYLPRVGSGFVKSPIVERVMGMVDRKHFTIHEPYNDSPQPIGYNATISAPHIHAHALEFFKDRLSIPKCRALDVGCGSGYLTLCMYLMGVVVGIDHFDELIKMSKKNVIKAGYKHLLESGAIQFITYDGRKGYPPWCPYDVIYVGASATSVPQKLLDQLKKGGAMLIPVGNNNQQLKVYERREDNEIYARNEFDVNFVPLTNKDDQYSK